MRASRLGSRLLAVGCAVALLGAGLVLGATPALAARGPVGAPSSSPLVTPSDAAVQPLLGAESQADLSVLLQSGSRTAPGVTAAPSLDPSNAAEAASSTSGGAYTALLPTRLLDTRAGDQPLGPGDSRSQTVTGGSVPAPATAVTLNVTATDTTASSYLTVYPAGGTQPLVSNLNWAQGETVSNLVIVPVGAAGQVMFYNDLGQTDLAVDLEGYFAPEPSGTTAGSYVPLTPARITDTRVGSGEPYADGALTPGSTLNIQVTGGGGVPASGVAAALLNVTVTDTSASSYLTVYPEGEAQPLASNLNWTAGETVANRVLVPVGPTGQVTVYNQLGSTDVVVDVDGYFTDGSPPPGDASLFVPVSPVRLLDTRQTGQTLEPGGTLPTAMTGLDGIASNAIAVVSNVTATDTTSPSYFTVYPGGVQPLASDLNWGPGQTVPNLTVASVGGAGGTSFFNAAGTADLVIDVFGYFVPALTTPVMVTTTSLPMAWAGTAYQTTLQAYAGTPPYSWRVSSGSLPSGLSVSTSGVLSGTAAVASTSSFVVTVTDSATPTAQTATAPLSLDVCPASPVGLILRAPTVSYALNWSGYVATGGPFTYVTGTFNVPSLLATPTETLAAIWDGIDGFGNLSLIQAGTNETYVPSNNTVYTDAWWTLSTLGYYEQPIAMTVVPGDRMTVTIYQTAASNWIITILNDTTGATFTTDQTYSAPQVTAEWVVEAPGLGGTTSSLGDYSPDVTFAGLSAAGPQRTLSVVRMLQPGKTGKLVQMSSPSALTEAGFAVAYGSATPPPP